MPKPSRFFGAAALLLAGCVQTHKTPLKTLVLVVESEIRNLDLSTSNDQNSSSVALLFLQTLVRPGPDMLPEADLVESWEVKDDRVYTFQLPEGAKFHDGSPVLCEDLEYNFRQVAGQFPNRPSRVKSSFADVVGFECPDVRTFRLTLKSPRPSFLGDDVAAVRIFPKRLVEKPEYKDNPVGSGPFRFKERKGRDLVFERVKPSVFFEKVVVRSIDDPVTRFLSLLGGDVDVVVNALSPTKVQQVLASPHLQVFRGPGSAYQYIGLNFRNPKLKDARVREALSLAIDRDSIIRHKMLGYARPATSLLSPLNYYAHPGLKPDPYDPERARKLLAEAKALPLSLELKTSTDRDAVSNALVLKDQLARVGVELHIRSLEFPTFYADIQKGNFDCFSLRWMAVTEPSLMNRAFHSKETPPGRNRGFYANAELDAVLDRAAAETNRERRRALYWRAQEIVARDRPYLSLWYPDNVVVATSSLRDFRLLPTASWSALFDARKE
jgi:peptide/nickel transport system substrate-binding protein